MSRDILLLKSGTYIDVNTYNRHYSIAPQRASLPHAGGIKPVHDGEPSFGNTRARAAVESLLFGRRWKTKALLLLLLFAMLRAFPEYGALRTEFVQGTWRVFGLKSGHLLLNMSQLFPAESHESKLTFRLVVPAVTHAFRLGRTGALALSALAGVFLLYALLSASYRISGSKWQAFCAVTIALCVWPGLCGFHEVRGGYYDSVALLLLVLSMLAGSPWIAGACVFTAAWTDERALLAAGLVILFRLRVTPLLESAQLGRETPCRPSRGAANASPAWILGSAAAYLTTRAALMWALPLVPSWGGIGFSVALAQLRAVPLGLWSGFAGGWVVLAFAVAALIRNREYGWSIAFCCILGANVVAALCVVDMTRGMAYCLPALPLALGFLRVDPQKDVDRLVGVGALISVLIPTLIVEGATGLWILRPFPWLAYPL